MSKIATMSKILYEMNQKDGYFINPTPPSPPSSLSSPNSVVNHENESTQPSSSLGSNSPILLLLLISVAAVVFISGLLHLLVRYFIKRPSSSLLPVHQPHRNLETSRSHSHALQRQLQQLFRQHDSGLDQAVIDALPVFHYKDIMGLKEPFDCAVCLCEFADQDKLRLLPACSHAFHISCIDTWLLSNSTCPLCRGILSSSSLPMEHPVSSFDVLREISNGFASDGAGSGFSSCHQKHEITGESAGPKRVFSVRLGKLKSMNGDNRERGGGQGEISRCNLDARRCYSMGTFQYVVGDLDLQVALAHARGCRDGVSNDSKLIKERSNHGNSSVEEEEAEEKKISGRTRGESFSVSKIWLWSKKNRLPTSLDSHMSLSSLSYYKFANEH
ncbi:hypothetical protein ACOSP7_024245 [Xanthoceras sorbifolium]|uniref:RING-type E3 ubiquitin transferase n=1 Tax=Xanthoceras sorbifolium TaxID=99658 RepID=A0ABQ8H938_9ROSI|nr:hypothetical protein JRO89_XS13G0190300 [Xanthoceras sorbifolium]